MSEDTKAHRALVGRIDDWLRGVGIRDDTVVAEVSVDFADLIRAALTAQSELTYMLTTTISDQVSLDANLRSAAIIDVQLFEELMPHLLSLQKNWGMVQESIASRLKSVS